MSNSSYTPGSSPLRALALTASLGILWCGLLAYLILVVPRHEKLFIEHRLALPPITEEIIEISRRLVKYWYAALGIIVLLCFGVCALFLANRRSLGWKSWSVWFLLAALPVAGVAVAWMNVAFVPVPFRVVPNGKRHFEARLQSLMESPDLQNQWHGRLAQFDVPQADIDVFLFFLDPLWDKDQRLRQDVSKMYCRRLAALDAATIADWQAEFARAHGSKPRGVDVACLFIQHDRLFTDGVVNPDESLLLKKRLQKVPMPAIIAWRDLISNGLVQGPPTIGIGGLRTDAAFDLIRRDELFLDGRWEAVVFESMCADAQARAD